MSHEVWNPANESHPVKKEIRSGLATACQILKRSTPIQTFGLSGPNWGMEQTIAQKTGIKTGFTSCETNPENFKAVLSHPFAKENTVLFGDWYSLLKKAATKPHLNLHINANVFTIDTMSCPSTNIPKINDLLCWITTGKFGHKTNIVLLTQELNCRGSETAAPDERFYRGRISVLNDMDCWKNKQAFYERNHSYHFHNERDTPQAELVADFSLQHLLQSFYVNCPGHTIHVLQNQYYLNGKFGDHPMTNVLLVIDATPAMLKSFAKEPMFHAFGKTLPEIMFCQSLKGHNQKYAFISTHPHLKHVISNFCSTIPHLSPEQLGNAILSHFLVKDQTAGAFKAWRRMDMKMRERIKNQMKIPA